jgi:hypothetical protein
VSDLENEITPRVYYESSKTFREVMMPQLSIGGKKIGGLTRCAVAIARNKWRPPDLVSEIKLVVLEFEIRGRLQRTVITIEAHAHDNIVRLAHQHQFGNLVFVLHENFPPFFVSSAKLICLDGAMHLPTRLTVPAIA